MSIIMISGYILLFVGAFLMVTSSVGILRMPDFFTRLHPVGVGDSLGAPLMILGTACFMATTLAALKLVILAIFMFITGSTACHALAKAAHATGLVPWGLKQNTCTEKAISLPTADTESHPRQEDPHVPLS